MCVGRAHRAPRIDVARRAASVARVAVADAGVVVVVVIIVRVYVAVASSELRRSVASSVYINVGARFATSRPSSRVASRGAVARRRRETLESILSRLYINIHVGHTVHI